MELAITIITGFMILGAIYAIHARDLLSAVIACGIVGYGLVICFLLLKAPDLAIVQIVVDTIYPDHHGCSCAEQFPGGGLYQNWIPRDMSMLC